MATRDPKAPGFSLKAQLDERFLEPLKRNRFAARTWFLVTVAVVLAAHAGAIGYFLYRDLTQPPQVAKNEETPVEVVVEPPPPPPAAPPTPKPDQKQEIEKPATSAPRAENDAKVETEQHDEKTEAPKAPEPLADGQPNPSQEAAAPADQSDKDEKDQPAEPPKPDVLEKDAEALDKLAPEPPRKPDEVKVAQTKLAAKRRKPSTAPQQFAGLDDTPNYRFAKPTKKSPVSGGTEDSRYLAIVYGLIMRHAHYAGVGSVTVGFEVDTNGEVVGIQLSESSGNPLADAAVINAVRRASPFPPPPPDRPHALTATINFAHARPALTMDDE